MRCLCSKKVNSVLLSTLKNKFVIGQEKKLSVSALLFDGISKNNNHGPSQSSIASENNLAQVTTKSYLPYVIPEKDQEIVNELKKGIIWYPYKSPEDRIYNITKEELKATGRRLVKLITNVQIGDLEVKYFPRHTDFLIIGSGAIGLLIAYSLRSEFPYGPEIMVVDKDINFPHSSTNMGQATLLQQQFNVEEEFLMSQYCAEFLSTFHRHTKIDSHPQFRVSYEPLGSLHLANETNAEKVLKTAEGLKNNCRLLSCDELKKTFPWLNLNGILFGSLGLINEGLFDPWSFLIALKCKAVNLGVKFITAEVIDFGICDDFVKRAICRLPDGTYNSIDFANCIVAASMESLKLLEMLNIYDESVRLKLPMEERKRYEYCFYSPNGPGINTPIIVDPDGTYFRREGVTEHYVAGIPSVLKDNGVECNIFNVFNDKVKPFLINRVPQFENLELTNGWIDVYEYNTANEVGILGCHPCYENIIFATGFSHMGLQYAPAVGRAAMEMLYHKEFKTIDFTPFNFENLYKKQKLDVEQNRNKYLESQNMTAITN